MRSTHALLLGLALLGVGPACLTYGGILTFDASQIAITAQGAHPEMISYAPIILAVGAGLLVAGAALVAVSPRFPRRAKRVVAKPMGEARGVVPLHWRPF